MLLTVNDYSKIAELFLARKVGVIPTDTIYGIHCLANDVELVKRVREIKQRDADMPMITLISSLDDLKSFDIKPNVFTLTQFKEYWPGPNTLILETIKGETRSFRLPKNEFLLEVLKITGPLISTSANLHSLPHSTAISHALDYFGDLVDFYVDGGVLDNPPSSIYRIYSDYIEKIR